MQIDEGRFLERPCPHCGRTERRAFGEVESPRGELASYALGWTSEHDDPVGHLTIGIGAGNPGGGTFHIDVRIVDDGCGMGLVDRPFEDVPEGGPHLTREQARAHPDLPFVWYVADNVMAQDRRAMWMEHWLKATTAYATRPILDGEQPVRHAIHDDDGDWQLLCGTVSPAAAPVYFHFFHALDADPTLHLILDLAPGERADRDERDHDWYRSPVE